jgi:hypothetical protein
LYTALGSGGWLKSNETCEGQGKGRN